MPLKRGLENSLRQTNKLAPTAVLVSRVDVRVLARLAQALSAERYRFDSRSELVSRSLVMLHDILVQNEIVESYLAITTAEAVSLLAEMGLDVTKGRKNLPTLSKKIFFERQAEMLSAAVGLESENGPQTSELQQQAMNIRTLVEKGFPLTDEARKVLAMAEAELSGSKDIPAWLRDGTESESESEESNE